jgi:outer membrane protein assembly factor BamB
MLRMLSVAMLVLSSQSVHAADWPHYRGPQRNDVSTETGLLKAWPMGGPALLWTYQDAGIGYSGPSIVEDRLFTIGSRGEDEFLIALNLKTVTDATVAEAWVTKVGPLFDWKGNQWSAGPSSTPTVDDQFVYALGGMGDLICARVSDGQEVWRKNLPRDLEAQVNPIGGGPKNLGWGFTWSPLVDGEKLICVPGGPKGTVAALDKKTGDVLWRSVEVKDQAAYTSPMVADIEGVRQYVVLTNQGLIGIEAKSGRVLWNHRRKPAYGTEVVNSPIIHESFVYATVGAGQGCDLLRIHRDGDAFRAESVYSNKNMTNHHGNVALIGDNVFGFSEGKGWICQALATGEIVWADKSKLRAGSMTSADGRIYCYTEDNGTVALIEASTTGWIESGRFVIPKSATSRKPSGRIWTPPVVSGGRLFLRDQELIFCYDVKAKD